VVMVAADVLTQPPRAVPDLSPQLMSVSLDGQPMSPAQLPVAGQTLVLGRQVERVVMAFSALDYTAPELRRYSYRLEGLDSRWIDVGGEVPLVFYSRLPVGQYTLLMRTVSDEFPGREWVSRIELHVPPAWYQRIWVWLVGALSLVGLAGGGLDLRLRRARAREQRLQEMVAERTEALSLANARLAQLAGEDALTGLSNRRRAFERMAELHAWRQRMVGNDCVVLMDLDHFKQTNDRYGHLGGDAVLRNVGAQVRAQLRTIDVAARYGGEELLLVLIDTGLEDGQKVVERLAQSLRQLRVSFNGHQIERADAALYRAKRAGRDRLCVDGH
jgi:diguanylate cyclase (GGDEF)-like protein